MGNSHFAGAQLPLRYLTFQCNDLQVQVDPEKGAGSKEAMESRGE